MRASIRQGVFIREGHLNNVNIIVGAFIKQDAFI